ncbi:MAG: PLP-dependent aminotransferase family protein [Dehalococcoidales bacterium]|nr:PLP-dependent aminotransferase family protein [Dehalococcoidales bacterium]
MSDRFALRLAKVRRSSLKEILRATTQPEVISFAGGLPAPELFPVEAIRVACDHVLSGEGAAALQYSETEGYGPLREYLTSEMARRGVACGVEDTLITTGSQQSLDLVARAFLDPGDVVLTEDPTYLAAIQTFQTYEARFVPVPTDESGIVPEALPELVARYRPKFLYTVPNFQNPTGITLTAPRREALYEVAARCDLLVVEDDPYGRLRYMGADIPPVKTYDTVGRVIYISTFSKTVVPGMRLGWIVATPEIIDMLVMLKQTADLHSSTFDQRVVYEYLRTGQSEAHIARIRAAYGERYRVMDEALGARMPAGCRWTHPEGGMFLWFACPEGVNTSALLPTALAHKVVFVPGEDFFPNGGGQNFMRLNFSNCGPERIREGVSRLAALVGEASRRELSAVAD